jgi:hypothetical protein
MTPKIPRPPTCPIKKPEMTSHSSKLDPLLFKISRFTVAGVTWRLGAREHPILLWRQPQVAPAPPVLYRVLQHLPAL